jgi:hypothetical protein
VRYDCRDQSFWVLAYVYSNYTLRNTTGDMWTQYDCPNGGCDGTNGDKFIAYAGDANGDDASPNNDKSKCPTTGCSLNACSCHADMWPVKSDDNVWIGYLAKAYFKINSGFNFTRSGLLPHLDCESRSPVDCGTAAGAEGSQAGVCFTCSGEWCALHRPCVAVLTPTRAH